MKSVIIPLLALIFTSSAAEFVIVPQPGKFSIFDQYEQPLSEDDKRQLLPNSPFQIINRDELMGDQITEALRFHTREGHFPAQGRWNERILAENSYKLHSY